MLPQYGFEAVDLRALVTPEMRTRVDQAISAAPESLLDFQFDGLPFGRLSVMDLVLAQEDR